MVASKEAYSVYPLFRHHRWLREHRAVKKTWNYRDGDHKLTCAMFTQGIHLIFSWDFYTTKRILATRWDAPCCSRVVENVSIKPKRCRRHAGARGKSPRSCVKGLRADNWEPMGVFYPPPRINSNGTELIWNTTVMENNSWHTCQQALNSLMLSAPQKAQLPHQLHIPPHTRRPTTHAPS